MDCSKWKDSSETLQIIEAMQAALPLAILL